jgi:hypothetical protein
MNSKRYIVIESTRYIGKFSAYDTLTKREIPCHNLATARNVCKEMNKEDKFCQVCECDPCDCNDGCKEEEYWKIWGDK